MHKILSEIYSEDIYQDFVPMPESITGWGGADPLPTASLTAANVLTQLRIKADLIYIDANHQYEGLMADLKAFSPLLAKGGILFGHDYGWESVQRAVVDFCKATGTGHRSNEDF